MGCLPTPTWRLQILARNAARHSAPLFEGTRYDPYSVEEARVFQRPIAVIEDLTGLDFGKLRTMDRMGSVEMTAVASARPIRGAEDIAF